MRCSFAVSRLLAAPLGRLAVCVLCTAVPARAQTPPVPAPCAASTAADVTLAGTVADATGGSDASGGVISIITRRVGDRCRGSFGSNGSVQQDRDAGDTPLANASLSGPIVPARLGLKLYGGYDRRHADGLVNPAQTSGAAPLPGFPANDNRFFATEAAWTPDGRHDVSLRYDTSRRDTGRNVKLITGESLAVRGQRTYLRGERQLDPRSFVAVGYRKRGPSTSAYRERFNYDRDADPRRVSSPLAVPSTQESRS